MILNKIVATIILILAYFLARNAFRIKASGRSDLLVEKIRTLGAALLLFILGFGFLFTKRDFWQLVPWLDK